MNAPRTPEQLLDVVRALVLLQGAILVAATVEALIWGTAFGGRRRPEVTDDMRRMSMERP